MKRLIFYLVSFNYELGTVKPSGIVVCVNKYYKHVASENQKYNP